MCACLRVIQIIRFIGLGACLGILLLILPHAAQFDRFSPIWDDLIVRADPAAGRRQSFEQMAVDGRDQVQDVRIALMQESVAELRMDVKQLKEDRALLRETIAIVQNDMNHGKWLISAVTLSVLAQLMEMFFRMLQRRKIDRG